MAKTLKFDLIQRALQAREQAVAPYSNFKVGAALLTTEGAIITGANVESASYGLTCCAERVALFKALTDGHLRFAAAAIVARTPGGAMPCGACRQLLAEYAPRARVWVADSRWPRKIREFSVRELLPSAFVGSHIGAIVPARLHGRQNENRLNPAPALSDVKMVTESRGEG